MGELFQPTHLLILMFFPLIVVPPFWAICRKAGFSPWFSLLIVVPWVNLIGLYVLAFSNWRPALSTQAAWPPAPTYPPSIPPPRS